MISSSIAQEWRQLSKTIQKEHLNNCSTGYGIKSSFKIGDGVIDSAAWCSSIINLSTGGVLNHLMSNDISKYFAGGNEMANGSTHTTDQLIKSGSMVESMSCHDQYWCSDATHLLSERILVGIFGLFLCCITLVMNILLLPVFNMVGIHSSATVFLTALAIVDCMWVSQCLLLICSVYLPGSAEEQQLTYYAFQVYLVPVLWSFTQYLESLMIWIVAALLLDRMYHLRQRVDVSMLFNRSRAVKITVAMCLILAIIDAPKLWRYHVVPIRNESKAIQALSSTYSMGQIELQMPGNRMYLIYLVVCKIILELVPGLGLISLCIYLIFSLCRSSRMNNGAQLPPHSTTCSGYNLNQLSTDLVHRASLAPMEACASLPSLASALDAPRHHIPRTSTVVFGQSEDYSLGPLILPSLFSFNQRRLRHMTVQKKLRLREGLMTQLAVFLTVFLLVVKFPYWVREIWLLSLQHRWLNTFTSAKLNGATQQTQFMYNASIFHHLSLVVDMSTLVMIVLRPVLYLAFAPHIRYTFRDMIVLCFRPGIFHTINLSGGMGAKITLNSGSSRHSSFASTRMSSRAGSITSLSQLRRNNSTLISLVNAYAMNASDGQNPGAVSCYPFTDLSQATKQLILSKHSPFLADAFTQAASTYPTNVCPVFPVQSSLSSGQSGGSSQPDTTQQSRTTLPPIESGDNEEYIMCSSVPSIVDEEPPYSIHIAGVHSTD